MDSNETDFRMNSANLTSPMIFDTLRSLEMPAFVERSTKKASSNMHNALLSLLGTCNEPEDKRMTFERELVNFKKLFDRYLMEKTSDEQLNWNEIKSPSSDKIMSYKSLRALPNEKVGNVLSQLAVLKLNGGLGTTMGCKGPKSLIEVRDGKTFLDLTVSQIQHLNKRYDTDVPLILMNSFNTDNEIRQVLAKYEDSNVNILTFNQSRFPRINSDSLLPSATSYYSEKHHWYPPGHGDIYESMANCGILERLISEGKRYLFISNIDNLGATVDLSILHHIVESSAEFVIELTEKTRADVKGGTLIDRKGSMRLLEIAQVPLKHVDDFKSVKKFKYFNTNNIWVSLPAIKRVLRQSELRIEIIVNPKTVSEIKENVLQLETALGAAIKHFKGAHGIEVPRSRFLPVKSCSGLFLVQSDIYQLSHGELIMNSKREFTTVPIVELGDHFKNVNQYLSRFKSPPQILELDHLTVSGDVTFGYDVQLKGTIIIVANHGSRIDIPSGSILENKVVSGNLRILDH